MAKVAIIGSGFSSLSAACFLAKEGYDVTIYEKNGTAGGRARMFHEQGFSFDMGPSWYWMPDIFERFFKHFGKTPADYYELKRLDPSYRIYFPNAEKLDVPAGIEALCKMVDHIEPGSSKNLMRFISEGAHKYAIGMNQLVYKPGLSVTELMDFELLKGASKLHLFQSISSYIRKYFTDPKIIQWLEFPVLFLGAQADKIPALYSLMNYADMSLGTWYPMGGMHKIIAGMVELASSMGVQFRFDTEVQGIEINDKLVSGIRVRNHVETLDYLVAGADYHHVEQQLLPIENRKYSTNYWDKRVLAPSSLIFYLGLNKKLEGLLHHTLFFDQDFALHAREIYENPMWPSNPQFYVSCPSKTDATVAPSGSENLFILIPVAPDLKDSKATRDRYFSLVMDRIEAITRQSIRDNIVFNRSYAHEDFISDYNAFKGNAYGLANTLLQTANLKPSMRNKKVTNLFYTGQMTVPGPGVPPSLISGEVAARELIRHHHQLKEDPKNQAPSL